MGLFSGFFKPTEKNGLQEKVQNGAVLLDVRTREEFQMGHVPGSINIPLFQLSGELKRLNRERPVVAICESGARSSQAVLYLKSNGFEAFNGGGWRSFIS